MSYWIATQEPHGGPHARTHLHAHGLPEVLRQEAQPRRAGMVYYCKHTVYFFQYRVAAKGFTLKM